MDVCYFCDLAAREAYRAVYDRDNGRLYVEQLAGNDPLPCSVCYEPDAEADLGYFGCFDRQLLSTVAAGTVAVGRARFCTLAF